MYVTLQPHPAGDAGPIKRIDVHFGRDGRSGYWARFELRGTVSQVVWPPKIFGGRADDLWRTTCFESFLKGDEGYWEFNFSPSLEWASFRFDDYRSGGRPAVEIATSSSFELEEGYAELEFSFERPPGVNRLGLSAVIEDINGGLSYWALAHPSDKPDFHHPDSFVLDLP